VHQNDGSGGGNQSQPENFARMYQNGVHRADGNEIMTFDTATGIEHQGNKTFTFRIEIRMVGNVHPPVFGGFGWSITDDQIIGRGTLAQRRDLVFVRSGGKLERLDQCVKAGEKRSRIHKHFRR